jgi:hypothetical protein
MKIKSLALGLAAVATLVAPIGVSAVAAQRAVAPVEEGSEIGGSTLVLALLGAAVAIGAIVAIADGGDDAPVSR